MLVAMTTADTAEFVSVKDPAAKIKQVLRVPGDPTKGLKDVVESFDAAQASVFKIRGLDVFLMSHIYDNASTLSGKEGSTEVGIHTRVNQTNIETVKFGLAAIPSNFKMKNGQPVRLDVKKEVVNGREYQAVTDKVMESLGLRLIAEMADAIKEISEVSADEAKNSAGASSQ